MSERKYRQRGYMDSGDADRSRSRGRPGPPAQREGPRGRGLGRPTATVFRCAVCGERLRVSAVAVDAACAACGADLHTCTHCAFFDTAAPKECRKPIDGYVASKAKRNACDFFSPKAARENAPEAGAPADPKAAFDALFKS